MLTVFTCFSLPMLYDYLVLYKPSCNVVNGSLVFIVNLSCYRLSPLDGLIDNSLTLLLSLSAGTPLRNLRYLCNLELRSRRTNVTEPLALCTPRVLRGKPSTPGQG